MDDDALLTIGRFAHVSGLSVHTLRHYDDVGLLAPAEIDPNTGYRRYRREQARVARLIRALRWVDLPVEEIRRILADPDGEVAQEILRHHQRRLQRQQGHLRARIRDIEHLLEKGITMPSLHTGCRPVQIKIAVQDLPASVAFYREAFGFEYDVTRRTEDEDYSGYVFGEYGTSGFFLLHLMDCPDEADRPGPSTFGLLVDDLDEVHSRAVEAGGTEVFTPHEPEGMPRCSAVKDPSGNWIWLYQG